MLNDYIKNSANVILVHTFTPLFKIKLYFCTGIIYIKTPAYHN